MLHVIQIDLNDVQRDGHEIWSDLGLERDLVGSHPLVDGAPALFVGPKQSQILLSV